MESKRHLAIVGALTISVFIAFSPLTPIIAQEMNPVAVEEVLPDTAATATPTQPEDTATVVINQDVSLPYGQWVEDLGDIAKSWLIPALLAAMTWVTGRYVPLPLRGIANQILTRQAEQILQKAIDYGIRATQGGEGNDAVLTIPVANQVLRKAANYVLANGWPKLIEFMDGPDGILNKIFARLNIPVEASAKDFQLPPPAVSKEKLKQITPKGKPVPSWVMQK